MQRVSTAFVGQVSAASSRAIAKLKGRARATNDPAYVPLASSHRAQSRRRRDLVAIFLDALGGRAAVSELQLVQVRKAAELTTAAGGARTTSWGNTVEGQAQPSPLLMFRRRRDWP